MNEKMMNQIEAAKKQTIGVEVEMNSITREKAARIAAEFFGTARYEYTARRNGYETWSAWDADGREWKFQKDVSIAERLVRMGCKLQASADFVAGGRYGKEKKPAKKLFDAMLYRYIASDAHRVEHYRYLAKAKAAYRCRGAHVK